MHSIRATARYNRAIHATAELLGKLRIDAMFVGNVARAAWLGGEITGGAVDVLALMNAPQKNQLAMMASNRGFRVDRDDLDQTEELDLVPLNFVDPEEEEVRVHVLLASNALYGRMVSAGTQAVIDDREVRVPRAEDLALLLLFAEDEATVKSLAVLPEFDRTAFQERLVSIGLGSVDFGSSAGME
ncbi:MAG TPA: hypothetical protein VGQ36_24495 [Thermoanaerobaculia bacterium]|jgi:hypothetical protein|nr:hypothetical protein [Thermoanaerobaculia bacterium]